MNHSHNITFSTALTLLMAMLDDRPEPHDATEQRRAVMGALKVWASDETPTPAAIEQACDDVQEVLGRFLASRFADLSTLLAVEVLGIARLTQCAPTASSTHSTGRPSAVTQSARSTAEERYSRKPPIRYWRAAK